MRPIISYDDITVPAAAEVTVPEPVPQLGAQGPPSHQRPTKRRKSNHKGNINSNQKGRVSNFRSTHGGNTNGRGRGGQRQYVQHWDDPNLPEETVRYGEEASAGLSPVDHEEQGEEVAGEEGIIVEEGDEDEDENEVARRRESSEEEEEDEEDLDADMPDHDGDGRRLGDAQDDDNTDESMEDEDDEYE